MAENVYNYDTQYYYFYLLRAYIMHSAISLQEFCDKSFACFINLVKFNHFYRYIPIHYFISLEEYYSISFPIAINIVYRCTLCHTIILHIIQWLVYLVYYLIIMVYYTWYVLCEYQRI